MKKIVIVCAALIVIMAAILGVLIVFGVMSFDDALMNLLKAAGAIAVLGVASAVISLMMGNEEGGG